MTTPNDGPIARDIHAGMAAQRAEAIRLAVNAALEKAACRILCINSDYQAVALAAGQDVEICHHRGALAKVLAKMVRDMKTLKVVT